MKAQLAVIRFIDSRGGPVDPGFGVDGPVDPGYGVEGPVDPGYGVEGPVDPGYGIPLPPVVDNGLPGRPAHPSTGPVLPTFPVDPGYGLPTRPGVWPKPPVGTWPPPKPIYPSHPIYPTDGIDNTLPGEPGTPTHPIELPPGSVWPPLPPDVGGKILAFCWLVGIGYRWVVLDPSLKPGFPIAPGGEKPDQGLPETPGRQPKRF